MKLIQILNKLAVVLLLAGSVQASNLADPVKDIPVQYQGRVLPFSSFAREHILLVTGKLKWEKQEPAVTVMGWLAFPDQASNAQLIDVGYEPLRKETGLDLKRRRFAMNELLGSARLMELARNASAIREQEGKPAKLEAEAEKVLNRMGHLYALVTNQTPAWVPPLGNPEGTWLTHQDVHGSGDVAADELQHRVAAMMAAYSRGDAGTLAATAGEIKSAIKGRWSPDAKWMKRYDMEVRYNDTHPIQFGRTLYLVSLLFLLVAIVGGGRYLIPAAHVALVGGFLAHVTGMVMRTIIGQRAPWSNFYESLVALTASMVLMGIFFARGRLRALALGGVAFAGFFALLIADRAGLSPGVDTLVPALQSYWLTIHVIIILSGYAVATIAMVLGHVAIGVEVFKPADRPLFLSTTSAIYRSVQMAMLLLFAGTILGGVWAHEAWGRYWGWDPKETWALISWFAYLGVGHARYAGWLTQRGMAMAAIGVYPIILMTYYGVNYLLSGLHSYAGGESAGVPPLLVGFLVFETVFLVAVWQGWHFKLNPGAAAMAAANSKPIKSVSEEKKEEAEA